MKIQSILGPIDSAELGQTLIHEHITCADWSMRMNFGGKFFDHDTVVAIAKRALAPVQAMGLKTLVDGTPVNLGREGISRWASSYISSAVRCSGAAVMILYISCLCRVIASRPFKIDA